MEVKLQIASMTITNNVLGIVYQGEIDNCCRKDKLQVRLCFENGRENRRIPIVTELEYDKEKKIAKFEGKTKIKLPFVFYKYKEFDSANIFFEISYGFDEIQEYILQVEHIEKGMEQKGNQFLLPYDFFVIKGKRKKSNIERLFLFGVAVLLFPYYFIDGILALNGITQQYPKMSRKKGLVGLLKHINARTKRFSGFSYSKRELKLHFFILYYKKASKLPVNKEQILFLSERRMSATGNLILIRDGIQKQGKWEVVEYQNEVTVDRWSLKELKKVAYLIATSKVIVMDDFYPQIHAITLRKETSLVQLWHACGAFKTFGFSRLQKIGGPIQESLNHRSYDYTFVSGEKIRKIYSEGFGISLENVLPLGVPRTDFILDLEYVNKKKMELYKKYPQLIERKVVLVAPTFRGEGNRVAYYPEEKLDLDRMCEQLPSEYCIIMKHHPFVHQTLKYNEKNKERILDLSQGEDINDLLFITDILVTDYSSVIFEACLLNIPMVFYAYDLEEYMADRDIYYDYEQFVPGPIVRTLDDVIEKIKDIDALDSKYQLFREYFMSAIDGNSTKRITDFINNLMEK